MENNKIIKTNSLGQKFIIDQNESYRDEKFISYHRNGMFQSVKSNDIFSVNEPSNIKIVDLPADYLGHITLSGKNRHLVFCGNSNPNKESHISEIGIIDTSIKKYSKLISSPCLNFNKQNGIITGKLRINNNQEEEVIFVDGVNPDRYLNISNIPFEYVIDKQTNCKEKVYNANLNCEELRLEPLITIPELNIVTGASGELPDGSYSVHICYLINDVKFSDYMCSTLPVLINNDVDGTNSIGVQITNLDRDFEKYQLVLTGTVDGKTSHKIIGTYPTSQEYVVISDWDNAEYQEGISSTDIITTKQIYESSEIISSNSEYLLRANVKRKVQVNYQPQAFKIKTYYVVKRVPLNYYTESGKDISYFRNENYNYVIRWFWDDGEPTEHSHIAGRKKEAKDAMQATGKDVFENDLTVRTTATQKNIEYWQAFNTAGHLNKTDDEDPNEISNVDEKIIGYGRMGYHESVIHYPEDKKNTKNEKDIIFGENACTPIRYHRMPDEDKVPRYWTDPETNQTYIQILGVKFENIEHPKDKNGNYIEGITRYEILRSERGEDNSTIVARGIVTNMGEFKDKNNKVTLYSNFPQNSIEPNNFLSKKQTWRKSGKEFDFLPLNKFHNKKYTFYTPHGSYFGRKSLASTYVNFETEEFGKSIGYFEEPHKHPKFKLLTNYAFYLSACIGVIETLSMVVGNKTITINQSQMPYDIAGIAAGSYNIGTSTTLGSLYPTQQTTSESTRLSFPRFYADLKGTPAALIPAKFLVNTLKILISLGAFVLEASKFVSEILETIKNFSESVQYARQYNCVATYNNYKKIKLGNKRRALNSQPFYLDNGIHHSKGFDINNKGRNSGIYLDLKYPIPFPTQPDNSRVTMSECSLKANQTNNKVIRDTSVFYVSLMKHNPNQYGSIEGCIPVKIHNNPISVDFKKDSYSNFYKSPVLFGGDCIITEQSNLNKFPLFRQDLTNTDFNSKTEYDYKLYNNIGYSRFWIDSSEYEVGTLMTSIGKQQPSLAKLPNQKYNLDLYNTKKNELVEKDQVFYTSVNGVFNYIVEVPYNIAFRSSKNEGEGHLYAPHYSKSEVDLSTIFSSVNKYKPEGFLLNPSYQYLTQKYVASTQTTEILKTRLQEKNTVLYSLPSVHTQRFNNWRYFLPLNRFTFDERDFGIITGIHALDQDRLLFLFSNASPFILPGRDMLQTDSGRNIIIGDGGLFAVNPREVMKTQIGYGSNYDRTAFNSNQFGNFYISEHHGKLFNFSNNLNEYSRDGWQKWCSNFIPLQLKKQFPEFANAHDPLSGVGYQIVFDNVYETLYICKKDFYAINENVKYNVNTNTFFYNNRTIRLGDPEFFEDCSMTLSYSPALQTFVSFHDWHPDGVIQEDNHFITAKGSGLWLHNSTTQSFCNFYGKDYPYQIGFTISTGQSTTVLNNIEWIQEPYIYKTNELDRFSPFNETFDKAMIYNHEQLSGQLTLTPANDIREDFRIFPKVLSDYQMEVPIKKAEGKWRLNMFYDYTKNRSRYENYDKQPFITKKNGYDYIINQPYLDMRIQRPPRFRNHWHSVWLSREKCDNIQFITKFNNSQLNISPR